MSEGTVLALLIIALPWTYRSCNNMYLTCHHKKTGLAARSTLVLETAELSAPQDGPRLSFLRIGFAFVRTTYCQERRPIFLWSAKLRHYRLRHFRSAHLVSFLSDIFPQCHFNLPYAHPPPVHTLAVDPTPGFLEGARLYPLDRGARYTEGARYMESGRKHGAEPLGSCFGNG